MGGVSQKTSSKMTGVQAASPSSSAHSTASAGMLLKYCELRTIDVVSTWP